MVKRLLDEHQMPYEEKDISTDESAKEDMLRLTGRLAVPVVVIDGEVTIGFDEAGIRRKLGID